MLELFFTLLVVTWIVFIDSFWLSLLVLSILIILLLPTFYAFIGGAPFLPSKKHVIEVIKEFLGSEKKFKKIVDLGCGDGRILFNLEDKSSVLWGYEFSLPTFLLARFNSWRRGGKTKIFFADFWRQKFDDVDVVVCFLMNDSMVKFKKKIWPGLKSGTYVISNVFKLPGVQHQKSKEGVYLYVKK